MWRRAAAEGRKEKKEKTHADMRKHSKIGTRDREEQDGSNTDRDKKIKQQQGSTYSCSFAAVVPYDTKVVSKNKIKQQKKARGEKKPECSE